MLQASNYANQKLQKMKKIYFFSIIVMICISISYIYPAAAGYKVAIAPIIAAAGISALSAGGQAYAQGKTNKKTREWNEKMYGVQREDAMADWQRVNDYNSPVNQMKLLREAKLNPNLVYGNGTSVTASPVRSSDTGNWNPQTPDYASIPGAALQGISAYQDYTMQQEQLKTMQVARDNMNLDGILKTLVASGKTVQNAQSALDLDKAKALYDTSIATAEEQLRSLSTGTDIKINQEIRDAAMQAPNLMGAFERVANIAANTALAKQQLQNLKKTGTLQQMEINMRKLGLSYHDNAIMRILAQFADGKSLPEVVQSLWDVIRGKGDLAPIGDNAYPSSERIHFPNKKR